jgi:hypothetical protein
VAGTLLRAGKMPENGLRIDFDGVPDGEKERLRHRFHQWYGLFGQSALTITGMQALACAVEVESFELLENLQVHCIDLFVVADTDWRADFFINAVEYWLPAVIYLRHKSKKILEKKDENKKQKEIAPGEKKAIATAQQTC